MIQGLVHGINSAVLFYYSIPNGSDSKVYEKGSNEKICNRLICSIAAIVALRQLQFLALEIAKGASLSSYAIGIIGSPYISPAIVLSILPLAMSLTPERFDRFGQHFSKLQCTIFIAEVIALAYFKQYTLALGAVSTLISLYRGPKVDSKKVFKFVKILLLAVSGYGAVIGCGIPWGALPLTVPIFVEKLKAFSVKWRDGEIKQLDSQINEQIKFLKARIKSLKASN